MSGERRIQFQESLLHSFEKYYGTKLDGVALYIDENLKSDDVIAYCYGTNIQLNPKFLMLDAKSQRIVLAHEIAHLFQKNTENPSFLEDMQMEVDANLKAILFGYEYEHSCVQNHHNNYNNMTIDNNQLDGKRAFGLGGIYTIKQVIMDKLCKKDGIYVDYEGAHEYLTRQAMLSVIDIIQDVRVRDELQKNKDSLILGCEINDLYFFPELYMNLLEKVLGKYDLLTMKRNIEIDLSHMNEQLAVINKKDSTNESTQIIASKIYTDNYMKAAMNEIATIFRGYIELTLAVEEITKKKDEVTKYFRENFEDTYGLMKKLSNNIFSAIRSGAGTIDDYLKDHSGIEGVKEILIGYVNQFFNWWENPETSIFTAAEDKIFSFLDSLSEHIDNIKNFYEEFKNIYCVGQFLMYSHTKDLQFLHSMDCSGGDIPLNREKCICFIQFLIDVYLNKKYGNRAIQQWNLKEYIMDRYAKDSDDLLVQMMMPLLVKMSYGMNCAAKKDAKCKGQKVSEKEKLRIQTEFIIETLKIGPKVYSFFSERTIGQFFNMYQKDNASYVALGIAMHMIEDSFTGSHTIRVWDINCGEAIVDPGENSMANLQAVMPPIIYFADYTKQDGFRHAHADLFVDMSVMPKDIVCNHCNQESNEMLMPITSETNESYEPKIINTKEEEKSHNCHRTVGAQMARKCAAQFLYLAVTIPKDKDNRTKRISTIEEFLRGLYLSVEDMEFYKNLNLNDFETSPYNMIENIMERIDLDKFKKSVSLAGRSFEKEELKMIEMREKYTTMVAEFGIANILDTLRGMELLDQGKNLAKECLDITEINTVYNHIQFLVKKLIDNRKYILERVSQKVIIMKADILNMINEVILQSDELKKEVTLLDKRRENIIVHALKDGSRNMFELLRECSDLVFTEYNEDSIDSEANVSKKMESIIEIGEKMQQIIEALNRDCTKVNEINEFVKNIEQLKKVVEAYRKYILKSFGRSMIPTGEYIQEQYKEVYEQDISLNLLYSSYAKRILMMYRLLDLPMLEKILTLTQDGLNNKEKVMRQVEHEYDKEVMEKVFEQVKLSHQRYVGHLYEIYVNVQWMREELKKKENGNKPDYEDEVKAVNAALSQMVHKYVN